MRLKYRNKEGTVVVESVLACYRNGVVVHFTAMPLTKKTDIAVFETLSEGEAEQFVNEMFKTGYFDLTKYE